MSRSLGILVKLLHEAAGHIGTVELKSGELYRGSMIECEDSWNCQLENITFTAKASLITCVKLFTVMYEDTIFDTKGVIKMQYADGKVAGIE
ncbi:hypothetical protein RHSIM_RhsimUnG0172200 [Rhododendron simsii]|uniref:Sm domain-containing protein n=1 Tax=Rhododendron simsii TaxID=118357 RepID=A0A834FUQ7_RHOSS|nr:hypothetical protein RHSIM_RhsimUnG0172200 [Rhododendron simsii]